MHDALLKNLLCIDLEITFDDLADLLIFDGQ